MSGRNADTFALISMQFRQDMYRNWPFSIRMRMKRSENAGFLNMKGVGFHA